MGLFDFLHKKTSLSSSGMLAGSRDFHSHVLFGVDDGVKTLEESLSVLACMESNGVSQLWCTPHVMEDIPNPTSLLQERFAELKEAYTGTIELHLAAEYMLDTEFEKRLEAHDLLPLYDEVVLVETSATIPPINFIELLQEIMTQGYRPMLAHPERSRYLTMNDYERLDSYGVFFQLNLPSIIGYYGDTAQKKAELILKNGWYKVAGSDCHRLPSYESQINREILSPDINARLRQLVAG
jgi:tyrosine-protein phosphatase YwqE